MQNCTIPDSPGATETVPDNKEIISPGFFPSQDGGQLYSCQHFPASDKQINEAVLLCHAVAHEYERCHRAMRQLAIQLARSGRHSMRFDYSGTGDSSANYEQTDPTHWQADISSALTECKQQSKCSQTSLIGIRLGANLAAQAVSQHADIENLILYAPVTDTEQLFEEWQAEQVKHDQSVNRLTATDSQTEILGFPVSESFRAQISQLTEFQPPQASLKNVLILTDNKSNTDADGIKKMQETLASQGAKVSVQTADTDAIWKQRTDKAIVPFKLLRRMVIWLKEVSA